MFNVGTQELLVILVLALVVVGPQKLPEIARSIGRGMREFRKMQDEVKDMVKVDLNPDPPSVYKPGVSGPNAPRAPHRTPRAAASRAAAAPKADAADPPRADEGASSPEPGPSEPGRPELGSPGPEAPEDAQVDEPPASAGAG